MASNLLVSMVIKHPANFKDEKETLLKSVQDKLPQRLLQCTTLAGRLGEHTEVRHRELLELWLQVSVLHLLLLQLC